MIKIAQINLILSIALLKVSLFLDLISLIISGTSTLIIVKNRIFDFSRCEPKQYLDSKHMIFIEQLNELACN